MADLVLGAGGAAATAYTIDQSLRFNAGDSAYLSKTFASAGDRKKWTFSCWAKRGLLTSNRNFFVPPGDVVLGFYNAEFTFYQGGGSDFYMVPSALYRDPSAWYHFVTVYDSAQDTESDRIKMYVNGEQITSFATETYPAEDLDSSWNNNVAHQIGGNYYYDGCLAEVYFIDGTAYAASDFGETDTTTNQWKPIDASGLTFGTNGFYQKYAATELANSFTDSAVKTVTAVGNAHTDTAVKKFGTASLQLDGTGDYLTVSDSSQWEFGTENWTIEFWVRFTGGSGSEQRLVNFAGDTSPPLGGMIETGTDDKMAYYDYELNSDWTKWCYDSTAYSLDTWYHYAIQRNGSTFKMFRDGVEQESDGTSSTSITSPQTLSIGTNRSAGGFTTGYIDEFRVSNVARYDGDFTVATEEFSPDINTLLLLHMDGANDGTTFTDSAAPLGRHTITANGDVTQTRAVKKVGDSSIAFDGTGDYLSLASSSDWNPYGIDFTVELWLNVSAFAATAGYSWVIGNTSASTYGWNIQLTNSGTKLNFLVGDGTSWEINTDSSGTGYSISTDTWYHVAVVKDGTSWTMYVDGTSRATGTASASDYDSTLDIGLSTLWADRELDGYIDEIRISNSARYTEAFTPQTTEFTADANTMLLIHSNWDGGLGADSSGNKNDFSVTNLVATDQMKDSPTNNFATWNPLTKRGYGGGDATLAEGNLKGTTSTSYNGTGSTFIVPSSGKWYAEFTPVTINSTSGLLFGIADPSSMYTGQKVYDNNTPCAVYRNGGLLIYTGDTSTSTDYSAYVAGDIVGVAIDMDEDEIWFAKNNTWQGSGSPNPSTGTSGHDLSTASGVSYTVIFGSGSTDNEVGIVNFGQDSSFAGTKTAQGNQDGNGVGDFYYEPPSGYLALCTDNLPDPEIKLPGDNFNTVLYTGDDSTNAITGVGFQPDMTWIKARNSSSPWWNQFDAVRTEPYYRLSSNVTNAQNTSLTNALTSFDSDGFTLGSFDEANGSSYNFAAWNWLGANGTATNENGDHTSTVSVNSAAGFSIVSYTGTYAAATVGHGLSQKPELIIAKNLSDSHAWTVGADVIDAAWEEKLLLDTTAAKSATNDWNDTVPTATVFSVGVDSPRSNGDGNDMIAYCFHSVEGYSKVGSYKGNAQGPEGTFVYTEFRPSFLLLKNIDSTESWWMIDDKRDTYNPEEHHIRPNDSSAEYTGSDIADFVSNGFKLRDSDGAWNGSATYIYLAFAAYPFKYAPAR